MKTILFIHGMGGGADSRVPRVLRELRPDLRIVARTYAFDPYIAMEQIRSWIDEVQPDLLMSESMGCNYALVLGDGYPRLFLSPALGAPAMIGGGCWLSLLPGIPAMWGRIFKPREGERQNLSFDFRTSYHFRRLRKSVRSLLKAGHTDDGMYFHALFGRRDFYRKWSVVRIREWQRSFGAQTCSLDEESHFWNEDRIREVLLPTLDKILSDRKKA